MSCTQVTWRGLPGLNYNIKFWELGGTEHNLTVHNISTAVLEYNSDTSPPVIMYVVL